MKNNMPEHSTLRHILVNGERVEVEVISIDRNAVSFCLDGRRYDVAYEESVPVAAARSKPTPAVHPTGDRVSEQSGTNRTIAAPIPGVVAAILVSVGTQVTAGEILLRLDAMKMENNIVAPQAGVIRAISVEIGAEVSDGQALIILET